LKFAPDPLDLGVVDSNRRVRGTASLVNPGSLAIKVERIESSCPCVRVSPDTLWVGPGASAELAIEFDPSTDPESRGRLAVVVEGKSESSVPVFHARVLMEVAAPRNDPVDEGGSRP